MSDKTAWHPFDQTIKVRFRDMGDGTYSECVLVSRAAPDAPVHVFTQTNGNQQISATMPAVAGKTNYLTGFEITGGGATLGLLAACTLTGLLGGSATYYVSAPAGVTLLMQPLIVPFDPPIPASAPNVAVTLTVPAFGLGNLGVAINLHGYTQ